MIIKRTKWLSVVQGDKSRTANWRPKFLRYFGGYLKIFALFKNFYLLHHFSRKTLEGVLWNHGWEHTFYALSSWQSDQEGYDIYRTCTEHRERRNL
jgi:hypothetical protein